MRPCVVLAPAPGAEAFAAAFDAEGWATLQAGDDVAGALARARSLDGTDPDGVIAWGAGDAAGALFAIAAADTRIAALVALTPAWPGRRAELAARVGLGALAERAIRDAASVSCPALVQIGDEDPAAAAARTAATRARAVVHHYPCDRAGVLPGAPWHEHALRHQVAFVRRRVAAALEGSRHG